MNRATNSAFVAAMEDVLAVCTRPHDPDRPLVCLDETSKQLIAETRSPIPMKAGRSARSDMPCDLFAPRQQLEAAIEFAREGDTLVVTKIDRLARSVRHLCEIVDRLQAKGVALRILNMNLDTNDATGKLMLQIIGSIAEFERSIMLSRQLEGIAKAKAEGKYRGGIPTARAKAEQVFALVDAGKTREAAAQELGISIRSVFRILRTRKDAEKAVTQIRTRSQVTA